MSNHEMASRQVTESQQAWFYDTVNVHEITQSLSELGYKCEVRASMRGMSGSLHTFDIVCKGNVSRIAIDFFIEGATNQAELEMVRARAKFYDCSPDLGIIVCLRKMSGEVSDLVKFYRFIAIEAADSNEICSKLREVLKENDTLENGILTTSSN
jgi:hypothetical protein